MFRKLLPFELNLQFKQVGFWVTLFIVLAASFGFAAISTISAGERIKVNGAFSVSVLISALSVLAIFFGAIYVVSGIMRDQVSKSLEVIHATPVPTPAMIVSRFIGAYAATLLSLIAMSLGVFLAHLAPWVEEELLGPIRPWYYIQPTLVFVVINALLVTAIFTTIATITRNRTLVYVSAVALFMLYTVSGFIVNDSMPEIVRALSDPFGTIALAQEAQFWAAAEQNTRTAPLYGYIGLNRIFWGVIALALFVYSFFGFKRGIAVSRQAGRGGAVSSKPLVDISIPELTAPLSKSPFRTVLARTKFEYMTTVKSIAFMILGSLVISMTILIITIRNEVTPDPTLPTSAAMSQFALIGTFLPLLLITIFFAGEIVWRDRTVKMTELLDSTPTKNWPFMAGKWLAMMAIVLTIVTVSMIQGILAQLFLGDVDLNLWTHFSSAFIDFAPRILLFAGLVMFVQNFMPNRIVGMIIGGVIVLGILFGVQQLPFYHPLMNFGSTPNGGFSEMNGFGDMNRYFWFLAYWVGLVGLFAVASIWLWRRGLEAGLLQRLRGFGSQFSIINGAFAVIFSATFVGAGLTIFNSYNDNNFETNTQTETRLTSLENDLGDKLKIDLPKIRDVDVEVQFYPRRQAVDASGTYRIVNVTDAPVDELYLSVSVRRENVRKLEIEGASWSHETDEEKRHALSGFRLYKFDEPLAVGEETTLSFDFHYPTPTLGGAQLIRRNGTFVNQQQIMPVVGLRDFRITNPDRRRANDLPELEDSPDRDDMKARQYNFIDRASDYVNFSAKVCTVAGQIPVAPGTIINEYEEDGRVCRDYQPNEPILNFFAFVSADYEVAEDTWTSPEGRTIELSILYDRQHDYNIELMLKAMTDSLDVFHETFGPYQYDTLRIMEFPYGNFAQSFAGTIPFSENIGFVRDPGNAQDNESIDIATYVTMHEIGHQWFAHQILPADVKGFNVLSEGLTENTAQTAYEATYGWQKARRMLQNRAIQQYLVGRTLEAGDEPPLATARGDKQYIIYNKASWVFWGLKQYIGNDEMQGAIRAFLDEYGRSGPPYPTTLELIEYLRDAAGPEYQQLITDYWDRLTFWDLKVDKENTTITANSDGTFKVDLAMTVDKRIASEETGSEVSVTEIEGENLQEWVEIGFYEEDPEDTLGDEWLKLERVKITELDTEMSFELATKPNYVLLDPRRLLIERNVDDNVYRLPEEDEA